MGLADRLAAGFKAEVAGRLVSILAGALMVVALARLLEPEGYGLLYLALAVLGVARVFSKLGISKSGARYLAEYKEQDPRQIPHILETSFLYNLTTIAVVVLALALGHRWLAGVLGEPSLAPLILFGTLFVAFGTLVTFARRTLQGFEQIRVVAWLRVVENVSRFVFAVGFVLLGFGAMGALGGYVASAGLVVLVGLAFIYARVYREHERAEHVDEGLRKRVGLYALPITATSTADIVDKRVDTILVGFFLNPTAVGFYVVAKQAVDVVSAPAQALGFTISPTFGAQQAQGASGQAASLYEEALSHSLLVYLPAAAGLIVLADPAVGIIFGPDYGGAVPVVQVLALYAVLHATMNVTSSGLDYLGKATSRAIVKAISSTLNVVLNVIMIPMFGVVGAAYATVTSYAVYAGGNFYVINTLFDLDFGRLTRNVATNLIGTLLMAGLVILLRGFATGWITLALVILAGASAWGLFAVAVGILDVKQLRDLLT